MKIFLALVIGICINMGFVLASDHFNPEVRELTKAEIESGFCRVNVGYGRMTPGTQCRFSDEVMTGTRDGGYVLCSRITVQCQ